MRSALIPAHILFPSGHLLPLRWLRLPLLIATLGLSCVCIAVGAQALDMYDDDLSITQITKSNAESLHRSSKLEMALNTEARRTRTMITFDMNGWSSL